MVEKWFFVVKKSGLKFLLVGCLKQNSLAKLFEPEVAVTNFKFTYRRFVNSTIERFKFAFYLKLILWVNIKKKLKLFAKIFFATLFI